MMEDRKSSNISIRDTLRNMTKQVIADNKLKKYLETYAEEGEGKRSLLCLVEFDNKAQIHVSKKMADKLKKNPDLLEALFKLAEEENDEEDPNKEVEEGEIEEASERDNEEASERNIDENVNEMDQMAQEEVNQLYTFKSETHKGVHLPKLFAPFKDKNAGWNDQNVKEELVLFLNILGYGHGGKSLVDTKLKKAEKPESFTDRVNFDKYDHPSKSTLKTNEDVLEGILEFYNYDVKTHCQYPKLQEKNQIKKIKKVKHIGKNKGILPKDTSHEEIEITDHRKSKDVIVEQLEASEPRTSKDTNGKEVKATEPITSNKLRKTKAISYMDQDSEEEKVPKKKKRVSFNIPETEWSDFEKNVIQKNIEERKKMEQALGIHKLAEEFKKTKPNEYLANLDKLMDSDTDDDFDLENV